MDIHTTLTLAVAAAILLGAMVIGFVVTSVVRVVAFGWRAIARPKAGRRIEDALPRTPLHVRMARAARGAARFVAASVARPVRAIGGRLHVLLTPVGPVPVPTEHRPGQRSL
ncbi:MAG TPA: hypothetical protein VG929_00260 [Actinomycetota bacterium]|nr:hypothetical protein [Actinomycetota bacterium]